MELEVGRSYTCYKLTLLLLVLQYKPKQTHHKLLYFYFQ